MYAERPETSEYDEFYETYVGKVPDGDVLGTLEAGRVEWIDLVGRSGGRGGFAYAPGKWTLREVLGHVIDSERVFAYRALHFARADPSPLPGMDQEHWAGHSNAADRPLAHLLGEFDHVRRSTIAMLSGLDTEAWSRQGVASGCTFTVRALAWIIAGHEIHHRRIVAERYVA